MRNAMRSRQHAGHSRGGPSSFGASADLDGEGIADLAESVSWTDRVSDVLQVTDLRKVYGSNVVAVDGVSFRVGRNEIVGLLGPNGAGKTTTINMILGVLTPTSGSIAIDGIDVARSRRTALERTNFAAVYGTLPGNLTVQQNLRVFGMLYDVDDVQRRMDTVINRFDLGELRNRKSGVLSSGEQTRLGLAKAFLNDPTLLLLDEPTASLDPAAADDVRHRILRYAQEANVGILWTSHNMYEVEAVCHRVLFLSHGKILLEGDPKRLPSQHGHRTLEELFIAVAREPLSLGIQ
jgi:ABC-2 type transport system ATP-binding protein